MNVVLNTLLILSIAVSAIIAFIRRKKTDPSFIPFARLLTITLIFEIISTSLRNAGFYDAYNYNDYAQLEFLIITWQFRRWGLFRYKQWLYYTLQGLCIIGSATEKLLTPSDRYFSYFIISHALVIILMSIAQVNLRIVILSRNFLRDPIVLICIGLVIYFTWMLLIETFWMYGLSKTQPFRVAVQDILSSIHLLTNILFVFATIWIPLKPRYIMRS
jgi:hypothetical protein